MVVTTPPAPTLEQVIMSMVAVLQADEKLYELLVARSEALAMGLPDRQVQVEDIDAEVVFLRRKLDDVEAYTKRERLEHGW